jgi:hypothetical protein
VVCWEVMVTVQKAKPIPCGSFRALGDDCVLMGRAMSVVLDENGLDDQRCLLALAGFSGVGGGVRSVQ